MEVGPCAPCIVEFIDWTDLYEDYSFGRFGSSVKGIQFLASFFV